MAGDPAAAARIARHHPNPPADLSTLPLNAAQLTLAREYGFLSWPRLRHYLDAVAEHGWAPERRDRARPERRHGVLPTGLPDLLRRPTVLTDGRRQARCSTLTRRSSTTTSGRRPPQHAPTPWHGSSTTTRAWPSAAAARAAGVRLAYLAYSRVSGGDPTTTARMLLDAGADPDEGYLWNGLPTPFTLLTGVFGEGEGGPERQPRHPESTALATLLLDRGAEPNDGQTLYNRMFGTDDDHLELLFELRPRPRRRGRLEAAARARGGRLPPAAAARPPALGGRARPGGPGPAARRARCGRPLASRRSGVAGGRRPLTPDPGRSRTRRSPWGLAMMTGDREIADYLASHGATPGDLAPVDAFVAAAMTADRGRVSALGDDVRASAIRARPGLVVWAVSRRSAAAVALLVELGFDVNAFGRRDAPVEQPWETALHAAAADDDTEMVQLLLGLGADPSARDARFGATPLEWARHLGSTSVVELLDGR